MAENADRAGIVRLSEEDILGAETYLPILNKTAIARVAAPACIQRMRLGVPLGGTEADVEGKEDAFCIPVPDLYREDTLTRTLTSAFVLLYFYLKRPDITAGYDPNRGMLLSASDYDRYPNLLTQIERMKAAAKDREVRDRAYALLADYKDFEKRLGAEIFSLLSAQNDVCVRLTNMMTQQMDPEMVKTALKKTVEAADKARKQSQKTVDDAILTAIRGGRQRAAEKKRKEAREARLNEIAKEQFGEGARAHGDVPKQP